MDWNWRVHARRRRGCNECGGAGRIAFSAEEIVAATVAATVADSRAHRAPRAASSPSHQRQHGAKRMTATTANIDSLLEQQAGG